MTVFSWIAIGRLIAKVVLMLYRRVPSGFIGLSIIAVLLITGTLPTTDALACFCNESVVLVGALCVVVGGLVYSGTIQWVTDIISQAMTGICISSPTLTLILIAVLASVLTEFMANTLCAAISLPIALNTASKLGVPSMIFCMTVLVPCNSAFCTPISSNNNILAYGPGSYRLLDYIRVGMPLKIIILITSLIAINILYPL